VIAAPIVGENSIGMRFAWRSFHAPIKRSASSSRFGDHPAMGFNRRKMEDERQQAAEKAAAARRATDAQVYVAFQMAEVAIPRQMFQEILRLIAELRPQPPPAPA
jgi:hypothetical protein